MTDTIRRPGVWIPLLLMLAAPAFGQSGTLLPDDGLAASPDAYSPATSGLAIPNDAVTASAPSGLEAIGLGEMLNPQPWEAGDECLYEDRASLESTGTWLQRGYWFSEQDFVFFKRSWNRSPTALSFENNLEPTPIGLRFIGPQLRVETFRDVAAHMRLTLGRFLFRDEDNRDHFTQLTFLGGGKEVQRGMIRSIAGDNLLVNPFIDDSFVSVSGGSFGQFTEGYPSFTASDMQTFKFSSRLNGLSYSYHLKRRMRRDQMVLMPEGQWVRKASPTITHEFLGGIRWIQIYEWLNWEALGDIRAGNQRVATRNNLLGFHVGAGTAYETGRFSVGVRGKTGVFVNFAELDRDFNVTGFDFVQGPSGNFVALNTTVDTSDRVRLDDEALSGLAEASLLLKYHIHQNFSLRFTGDAMFITNLAFAPPNTTFAPQAKPVGRTGDGFYLGFGVGIEGYW